MYIYILLLPGAFGVVRHQTSHSALVNTKPLDGESRLGLYTILLSPILYGMYCNNGRSGEILYCAIAWTMKGASDVLK